MPLISTAVYASGVCVRVWFSSGNLFHLILYFLSVWDLSLRRSPSFAITSNSLLVCVCVSVRISVVRYMPVYPCMRAWLSLPFSLPLLSVCGEWRDSGLNFNGAAISQQLLREDQCRLTHSVSREKGQERERSNLSLDIHARTHTHQVTGPQYKQQVE